MASGDLQGWYEDPYRLHEARYFSAGHPTKLVRDGTVESYDEPPSQPGQATGAAAGADWLGLSPVTAAGSAVGAAPLGASSRDLGNPGAATLPPRRRTSVVAAVLLTATLAGAVVGVVSRPASSNGPRTHATSPVALVAMSAQRTLARRTAAVTVSGTIRVASHSVTMSGTGQANFSANAMKLTLGLALPGHSIAEREILVKHNLYYALTIDGKTLAAVTGGREWVQMPVAQTRAASLTGRDPLSALSVLVLRGNTVRKLGTKSIGGVSCTGYAVTPSKQAMIANARKMIAKFRLPPAIASLEMQLLRGISPPTTTVWLDRWELIREMSVNVQMGSLGGSGDMVLDFSNYGEPVRITAPPRADTISFKSFVRLSGHGKVP